MDDLDRLYFEFVDTLRRERPSALNERLTVTEVTDRLIPYRKVRNPAGFSSNDDYEAALSRLLSGERDYLQSEGEMQAELKAGLEESLPDIRRYRAFPDSRVWLNPAEVPPPGDVRYAPPELQEQVEWPAAVAETEEERAAEAIEADSEVEAESEGGELVRAVTDDLEVVDDTEDAFVESEQIASEALPAPQEASQPSAELELCPQCGTDLPQGAAFCPFCGCRLSPEICPECGAEVEATWRYCAACGTARTDPQTG